ncbi:MAG: hypothetical protein JF593_06270 [Novosphingobium sp.]|nr:hypothetical protein [Novosphingobium sp.]
MGTTTKLAIAGGLALLALAGCKQENNYPASSETTEAVPTTSSTTIVTPGPTSTSTVAVPVPGATETVTSSPSPAAT